jgi:hypothetical protein
MNWFQREEGQIPRNLYLERGYQLWAVPIRLSARQKVNLFQRHDLEPAGERVAGRAGCVLDDDLVAVVRRCSKFLDHCPEHGASGLKDVEVTEHRDAIDGKVKQPLPGTVPGALAKVQAHEIISAGLEVRDPVCETSAARALRFQLVIVIGASCRAFYAVSE